MAVTKLLQQQEQNTKEMPSFLTNGPVTNDKIFDLLFNEEDITWQSILYELVKTNKMDPWDIDVSTLSKKFIDMIKKLKGLDFRISGKVVLASAILLKIKSNRFLIDDISAFDSLLHPKDQESLEDSYLSDAEGYIAMAQANGGQLTLPMLFPRTPQPRKRKVSIFDLVKALEKALEVKNRRIIKEDTAPTVLPPVQHRDISLVIKDTYDQIKKYFSTHDELYFHELLPLEASKDDKVLTFIPLLHLQNQQRIDLMQEEHFGDIGIELLKGQIISSPLEKQIAKNKKQKLTAVA